VLQCAAVCCSALQCVIDTPACCREESLCSSVLQFVAVRCSALLCVVNTHMLQGRVLVLQCIAVCSSLLQCVAVCCCALQCVISTRI